MFDPSAFAFGSMMPASAPAAAMTVCMAAVASGPWRNKVTTDGFCLATNDIKWLRDFQGCCWPGTKSLKPSQTTYHTEIAIKTCNYCTGRYIARTHTHTQSTAIYLENSRASSCMQADTTAEEFFVFRLARLAASFQCFQCFSLKIRARSDSYWFMAPGRSPCAWSQCRDPLLHNCDRSSISTENMFFPWIHHRGHHP